MVLAYAVFDLHLPGCRGLKEKRMIVRSLKSRVTDSAGLKQLGTIIDGYTGSLDHLVVLNSVGFGGGVSDELANGFDALLQKILTFVEQNLDGELLNYRNEFIHL